MVAARFSAVAIQRSESPQHVSPMQHKLCLPFWVPVCVCLCLMCVCISVSASLIELVTYTYTHTLATEATVTVAVVQSKNARVALLPITQLEREGRHNRERERVREKVTDREDKAACCWPPAFGLFSCLPTACLLFLLLFSFLSLLLLLLLLFLAAPRAFNYFCNGVNWKWQFHATDWQNVATFRPCTLCVLEPRPAAVATIFAVFSAFLFYGIFVAAHMNAHTLTHTHIRVYWLNQWLWHILPCIHSSIGCRMNSILVRAILNIFSWLKNCAVAWQFVARICVCISMWVYVCVRVCKREWTKNLSRV